MDKKVKTVQTSYLISLNNEIIERKPTLKEARLYIKSLAIHDDINEVHIIKQTTTESLLYTYKTKTTKILVCSELDSDLTFD